MRRHDPLVEPIVRRHVEATRRGARGAVVARRTDPVARFHGLENMDRDTLDLEALRPHFATDSLEKALRAAIKETLENKEDTQRRVIAARLRLP